MPLNQPLYSALVRTFKTVKIAKEGRPMGYVIKTNPLNNRKRIEILEDQHGEQYCVSCPFCSDERHRLWISHRWGTEDKLNGVSFGHLVNCFNDGCDLNRYTQSPDRGDRLTEFRNLLSPLLRHTVNIEVVAVEAKEIIPQLPEQVVPIDQLEPGHTATSYLGTTRGFDLGTLSEFWTVLYCPDDPHPFVDNRIILPVQYDQKLAGWQARYIGKASPQIPKYYTMPGMRKKRVIYNYDRAQQYPVGVLVEGATDAWTVGLQGIATFGAEVSQHQVAMMVSAWGDRGLILLPDGDVLSTEEKRERYGRLKRKLQESAAFAWGVLEVLLPPEMDPGSYTSNDLWVHILGEAERQGYDHEIFSEHAYKGACRR